MKKIHLIFTVLFACILFFTGCKKEEYIVTFNPNGGKGALITQNFSGKTAQSLMANTFTHSEFTFKNWNTKSDGTGTSYKDEETIKVSGHMILYAQWQEADGEFTVTFNANGGTDGKMEPQKFEGGVPQALSVNRFFYDNYEFIGWCTSPNGKGTHFSNEQIISVSSNMMLYAQWEISQNTFFVIFDANGGIGTMEPQAFVRGNTQKLDSNTFTRNTFIFTGWNTKKDGNGYPVCDKAELRIYENIKLYAQWMKEPESCPGISTFKDVDGNFYNIAKFLHYSEQRLSSYSSENNYGFSVRCIKN
jgi:hypothetical protein